MPIIVLDLTEEELEAIDEALGHEFEGLNNLDWDGRPDLERASDVLDSAMDKISDARRR